MTMQESFSIFDGIVNDENRLTALLYNFLRDDLFRNEFLNILNIPLDLQKDITYSKFHLQYSIGELGRPDLAIETSDLLIYIEIKTNDFRSLTNNQVTGYLTSLRKRSARHKQYIFLIPSDYRHMDSIDDIPGNSSDITVSKTTWENIIHIIHKNKLIQKDPLFQQYSTFLNLYFVPNKIQFMEKELAMTYDTSFAAGIDKTYDLIDNIRTKFKNHFPTSFKKCDVAYEYGFELIEKKKEVLFYGIWFHAWKKPVCLL